MEKHCVPDSELPEWAKPKSKDDPPSQVKSNAVAAAKNIAFVVGSALLVFASVRNSVTWQFERFWGGTKSFYEDAWNSIYSDLFGKNDFILATFGVHAFLFVYFWLNSLFFMYLDIYQPKFFMKYKIQEDKKLELPKLYKAISVCMRNQFIGFLLSFPSYYVAKHRGMTFAAKDLPSFQWVLIEFAVYILVEEVGFYYSHRLMHHPRVYKHIHKIHHEWTASISIIGIYAHPLEHILSNVVPVFLGPLIIGSHFATFVLWMCIAYTSTQISHGGYHLPFLPSPEAHDFHHLKFTNNFGVMGVLDRLHGTDSMFRQTKAYDRHIMLIGLTPAKELYPEEDKKVPKQKQQ